MPAGPIYNVEDMLADEHFQERGVFESVEIDGKPLDIPALFPRMTETPGQTRWAGAEVGSHNDEILGDALGLSDAELSELKEQGVI